MVKCSDNCEYTLEITHQDRQMLRFDQEYQGTQVMEDGYTASDTHLDLFQDKDNADKNIFMFISTSQNSPLSFESLDISVNRYNKTLLNLENPSSETDLIDGITLLF